MKLSCSCLKFPTEIKTDDMHVILSLHYSLVNTKFSLILLEHLICRLRSSSMLVTRIESFAKIKIHFYKISEVIHMKFGLKHNDYNNYLGYFILQLSRKSDCDDLAYFIHPN